jgi:type IV pilus assembly protein PilV
VRNEPGFTLIEAMIASVILATGLLALSFMQASTLNRSVDSNELTRATSLAAEMVERMQFNRRRVTVVPSPYNGINTAGGGNCNTISATNDPMARGDCEQWRALLTGPYGAGLSGVTGSVSVTASGPTLPPMNRSLVRVRVNWTTTAGPDKLPRPRQVEINTTIAPE